MLHCFGCDRVAAISCSSSWILTRFPFGYRPYGALLGFPIALGPAYPCSIAVHMEPFSTSVFKSRIWILATATKICTRVRFSRLHRQPVLQTPRPPTHSTNVLVEWLRISLSLKRHPFSGLVHSAGELLHTP